MFDYLTGCIDGPTLSVRIQGPLGQDGKLAAIPGAQSLNRHAGYRSSPAWRCPHHSRVRAPSPMNGSG